MKTSSLALFDLDHTLLPIDSDRSWGQFLSDIGAVDRERYQQCNDEFYGHYQAGTLNMHEFLRFALAPLAAHSRAQLDIWHKQFMQQIIKPALSASALALVEQHRTQGDMCAIVTATNSFIARPIAQAFGIDTLIATELATVDGSPHADFTGFVEGIPSFREGKITRTEQWLSGLGLNWESFEKVYFYSDSINDLPLLEKVNMPIATNPDPTLRATAQAKNWSIIDLFSS